MSNLTLRIIRAKHGDCLILFAEGATMLVDGGPSGVYRKFLKPTLNELGQGTHLDLVMVSHIDADHIDGILDLTHELIESQQERADPIVTVGEFWHNSFSDEFISSQKTVSESMETASAFNELGPVFDVDLESKLVLSSVSQGRGLRLDIKALNIRLNNKFSNNLILHENQGSPWEKSGLEIKVIGPTVNELEDLRVKWQKELPKILAKEGSTSLAAAQRLDRSVHNLASIVAIARADDKSILLTGDARGDMILEWLDASEEVAVDGKFHFDVLKIPHHGSDANVSPEFFSRVTADHYVVCGNGGHGNPEPEMFEMLFSARPNLDYEIHMTYGLDELITHKSFKKAGNIPLLKEVFSDPRRTSILRFPDTSIDDIYIDLSL